jgi:hypothetical protein
MAGRHLIFLLECDFPDACKVADILSRNCLHSGSITHPKKEPGLRATAATIATFVQWLNGEASQQRHHNAS